MSKIERLYHLHNILSARRTPASRQYLMDELGCSQATLYRLINELRDFLGAPLEQDPETKRFYYDRKFAPNFELPGIWISPQELQGLLFARQILSNVQPGLLEDELTALQGRIASLLQQKGIDLDAEGGRINIQHSAGRAVPARMFQDVLGALLNRKRLQIRYHGRGRDEVSERDVSPQRLTHYRDNWYLDGWCHKADGLRSFALERIIEQNILEEPAEDIALTEVQQHNDQTYGIFSGPAEHTALLLFEAERARWIADEQWHPDQQGEWQDDGRYLLKVPFSHSRELVMDIMKYGPEVEVLEPGFLREQVQEALKETEKIYDN